ncbi:hypothetical protein BTHE68_71870 (plasmid) [Burkholderia sp. THE68]|uniref:hypothetical protein n=1 Tax=Burkholderia sp. THE68 TaxID=758782 RepID=UPI001315BD73|nr:hypothetical protein [Burkholderia sp. THE68]BBU33453.1 hypothetical protein BTHE68_71870 [Burkholderia sp. THE68]
MTDLGSHMSNDCPVRGSQDFAKRCEVPFPNLIAMMYGETPKRAADDRTGDDDYCSAAVITTDCSRAR